MSEAPQNSSVHDDAPAQEPTGNLKSLSFVGLVITQILGAFNDNLLRWLSVPLAQSAGVDAVVAVSVGGLCLTLPFLLFMPMAGWLADRFDKRSVIVICKVAELILMLASVVVIVYGQLWMLFVLVFLLGTQAALFGPAKFGTIPEILPTRLLSKANGILGMGSIIAIGLGTIAGFVMYEVSEPQLGNGDWTRAWPVAALLVAASIGGIFSSLLIHSRPAAAPDRKFAWNPVIDLGPALKIIFQDRWLLRTALGIAFFFYIASIAQQNITPFVENVMLMTKSHVGIFLGILIAGVGVGSLLAGMLSDGKVELGIVPVGALGMILSAIFVALTGALMDPSLPAESQMVCWAAGIGLFVLGGSAGLYSVPLEAYLQYRSDPQHRGMVLAGSFFISYVLIVISFGVFYVLSAPLKLSPSLVFLTAAVMTLPVLVYSLRILPDWTLRFLMWLAVKTFYRFRVYGRHHIPETGPALIVSNHISFLDGVLMCISNPRFVRFIIYANFAEHPLLNWMGRFMRVIPIRATDGPSSIVRSIQTAREALKNGEVVCIFAEGGLSRTGQIQSFQRGLAKIVQGTDAVIIPAYMHGLWGSIFSWRGGRIIRKWPEKLFRRPIALHFGEPLKQFRDVASVRQAVERLGAEAEIMNASSNELIPVRKFIRRCKSARNVNKLSDSTNVSLTGGKLLVAALALRRTLRRLVLGSQEKQVGVLLPPSAGGCLANMALALDRRVAVNLNYTLSEEIVQHCVDKAGIKHILTSKKFLEKKPYQLTGVEYVLLEDVKPKMSLGDKLIGLLGTYLTPAWLLDRLLGLSQISPDETLTVIFTSGSTGEPKGVVLSHANVGSNVNAIDQLLTLTTKDGLLGALPFFHSFGYTACLWLPMCYPVRGVYHFNPLDAKVIGRLCQDHAITIMMATPTFLKMYLRRCEKEQFETVDLIVVGAEKLPVDLAREFEEKFGIMPTEGYGTTELSPVAAVNVPDHRSVHVTQIGTKLGTVGRPLPGVTAKVVDPDSFEDRGIEAEGLLLIKGPNVMRGYLGEPEKTKQVIRDGWYNTGDFAMLDKDGFVTITGRQSRFSKIGGEMVPHIRIEMELIRICESPEQNEELPTLVVTAVPDEDRGERLVVLYTQICKPVDQVIRDLAQTGIPKLWIPSADSFIQVEVVPILGTGKLDLKAVKELALQACCEGVNS